MSDIVTIAGSPSHPSRSSAVLELIGVLFETRGLTVEAIQVRDLPADALLAFQLDTPEIRRAIDAVTSAQVVVVATPVYKAAYSGLLKVFLDTLSQGALADKVVFPIATGGSAAHLLAIDYALKPVLSALGAQHVLNGLYIQDSQLDYKDGLRLDVDIETRLIRTIDSITSRLIQPEINLAIGK